MSVVPGLEADVHFGKVDDELPDWREEEPDVDAPDEADEPDDHSNVLSSLYDYSRDWWTAEEEPSADSKVKG